MHDMRAVGLFAGLLAVALHAVAAEPAKVQCRFERDGKTYVLTHAVAWQAARPDTLVLVLADADVDLMDVRHASRLQQLAEEGKVHGLRFEFDPAHLDLHWISGRFMTPGWSTYRAAMGTSWQRLEVANGRIAGKLDAGAVQLEFDVPLVGAVQPQTLAGAEAQRTAQADALIGYENAVRKGSWKEAAKYLTPQSAAVLQGEVSTPHGLAQFQTAGRYMKELLANGDARRQQIQKVVVSGEDAAVIGTDFAADFVLVGGRWLKI